MSTSPDPHADEVSGPHGADDHGEDHGHDDHAHEDDDLGPVDVTAWGAGALGIAAGLVVAVLMAASIGWFSAA